MKIRTVTTGFTLSSPLKEKQFKKIADFTIRAKREFERSGFVVQTARTSTQPWEQYYQSKDQIVDLVQHLEEYTTKYGLDFFNIGTTTDPENMPFIYAMLKNTSVGFCTTMICNDKTINYEAAKQTAKVMKKLSTVDPKGFTNLRFSALFNTKPGSPFYPAAYHDGPTSFAVGTENSDLVYKAFSKAKDIQKAGSILKETLEEQYKNIEKIAEQISEKERIQYDGIDVSIATSVDPDESIAYAFEQLGLGKFGEVGTLAVAKIVTDTVKSVNVKKCGYSGLMLPVLEDYGLAMRNNEGSFNISNILLYSAVCGTGLDTIPLPGDITEEKLYALLLDIASLSIKLNKPLSARLMPVPNKRIGEMTEFDFEYFVNTKAMNI